MASKTVYGGEWVRTSMLSARFDCSGWCSICHRGTAGPIWHSIKTGEDRCSRCFTPPGLIR